jgi:hypothetical protein
MLPICKGPVFHGDRRIGEGSNCPAQRVRGVERNEESMRGRKIGKKRKTERDLLEDRAFN